MTIEEAVSSLKENRKLSKEIIQAIELLDPDTEDEVYQEMIDAIEGDEVGEEDYNSVIDQMIEYAESVLLSSQTATTSYV